MAEVRKKVVEDKYNTSSIKKSTQKKEVKKGKTTNTKKVEKNEVKEKKGLFTRFRIFCNGVKSEFQKVHWPTKENMIKYSIATVFFILFCGLFFYLIDVIFAFIRSLF